MIFGSLILVSTCFNHFHAKPGCWTLLVLLLLWLLLWKPFNGARQLPQGELQVAPILKATNRSKMLKWCKKNRAGSLSWRDQCKVYHVLLVNVCCGACIWWPDKTWCINMAVAFFSDHRHDCIEARWNFRNSTFTSSAMAASDQGRDMVTSVFWGRSVNIQISHQERYENQSPFMMALKNIVFYKNSMNAKHVKMI